MLYKNEEKCWSWSVPLHDSLFLFSIKINTQISLKRESKIEIHQFFFTRKKEILCLIIAWNLIYTAFSIIQSLKNFQPKNKTVMEKTVVLKDVMISSMFITINNNWFPCCVPRANMCFLYNVTFWLSVFFSFLSLLCRS